MPKKIAKNDAPDEPGFEHAISEVEAIIERIEGGELGLEEQIAAYERGARLLGRCRSVLAQAEQRVRRIDDELDAESGESEGIGRGAGESDDEPPF